MCKIFQSRLVLIEQTNRSPLDHTLLCWLVDMLANDAEVHGQAVHRHQHGPKFLVLLAVGALRSLLVARVWSLRSWFDPPRCHFVPIGAAMLVPIKVAKIRGRIAVPRDPAG